MANSVCETLITKAALEAPASRPNSSSGAVVDFCGVVRHLEGDREIDGIDYEAHPAMADHQMRMIAEKAVEKFGLHTVILHHRLGFVPAGETSLFLRVASRNRAESFEASQWIVDELKAKVPIWKHPQFKTNKSGSNNPVVKSLVS